MRRILIASIVLLIALGGVFFFNLNPDDHVPSLARQADSSEGTGNDGATRHASDAPESDEQRIEPPMLERVKKTSSADELTMAGNDSGVDPALDFVPHSGPFARGIHATIFATLTESATTADVTAVLADYYRDAPFVQVADEAPRVKDVAGSNYAKLNVTVRGDTIVVCSVLDNLIKGAAGGAVQWVNRLLGLPDTLGLDAPAPGWL